MAKKFNALIFDTRSIQRYIFSGNLLRTNIGASYIVDRLFFDVLVRETLGEIYAEDFSYAADTTWEIAQDEIKPWRGGKKCCVAYIGGGNALILFDADFEDRRREVVEKFSLKLLTKYPGLKIGAALGELTLDGDAVNPAENEALHIRLKENQNRIFPAVNVPYSGLTLSCEINGAAANFCDTENLVKRETGGEIRFYSQETAVKAKFAKPANDNLKSRFKKIFAVKNSAARVEDFEFPAQVNELGQKDGENYFAIVHVDGNNMGVKFRSCQNNLFELRRLSRIIRRKTEGAFADLLLKIIDAKTENLFAQDLNLAEKILPIRPLIIGGDDVTFICPAKMAILFTKTLMENLDAQGMDCCGGAAIVPTAYPFFRGYELAEQLCDAAKKSMRQLNGASSWLDFAILHGEQAPTLEQIRRREYTGARGNLHFGPYLVANKEKSRYNLENLLSCATQFPKVMARGKIKELRFVLQRGKDDAAKFLQQLELQGQKLPLVPDWETCITDLLWSAEKSPRTPYVDAIELMDFYSPEVAEKWQSLT